MEKQQKVKLVEKMSSLASTASGTAGFLGGWQVCHTVCLGLISLLSVVGITLVGMPLFFLTRVAVPLWIAAVVLWVITVGFYLRMKCISRNLALLNAGIIIAGVPFAVVKPILPLLWIVGGAAVVVSVLLMVKGKIASS